MDPVSGQCINAGAGPPGVTLRDVTEALWIVTERYGALLIMAITNWILNFAHHYALKTVHVIKNSGIKCLHELEGRSYYGNKSQTENI